VLGGGDCPIVRHNVTFDEVWLYNTSTFDNFTFFFGSHWGARDTPPVFADYQSSCAGFSNPAIRRGGSFVFKSEDIEEHEEQELASHCDEVFFRASEKLGSGGNQLFFRKDGKSFAADFIRRRKRRKKTNNYNSLFTSA
jgi:hypothetical protein